MYEEGIMNVYRSLRREKMILAAIRAAKVHPNRTRIPSASRVSSGILPYKALPRKLSASRLGRR